MIQHPPAFCPVHGIFPARVYALENSFNITFTGCKVSCPVCNRVSEVISGTYDANSKNLNFLVSKDTSEEALQAIITIAEKAKKQEITLEEAAEQAKAVVPEAGKLFDIANWSDQAKATLYGSIIGAAGLVLAAKLSSTPESAINIHPKEEKIIERIIERGKDGSSLANIPIPTKRPTKPD